MRVECVNAVQTAIGRELTAAEAKDIDDRLIATMRRLASRDPQRWGTMPRADRLAEAGRVIAQDLAREADLRETRAALQIEAHARHLPEVESAGTDGFNVIQRKLKQADAYIRGTQREVLRQALDAIDFATKNDRGSLVGRGLRWVANLEDPQKLLAFAREVFGNDSGDAGAKAAAKAWVDADEGMRTRFNAAGGDVRKLGYNHLPNMHDGERIAKAGLDAWVTDTLRLVDRQRYTDERGRQLNDVEMAGVLEQAYRDIVTDGLAAAELGAYRPEGALANAGSQARVIHFRDGDSYVAYHSQYGTGNAFDAISGHVRWMAKNIGLVETFGPSPAGTFRTMHDTAELSKGKDSVAGLMTTQDMWDTLTAKYDNPRRASIARLNQGMRSIEVAGKLAQATLSAISDVPLLMMTLGYHRLPVWQGAVNLVRAFGKESREFAEVAGMMGESLIGDMHRWGEGNIGRGWPSMLANATMKLSLLQAWTDGVRRAFSISMMAGMGKLSRTPWQSLEQLDRARLERAGWTPDEWALLQRATPERWRNTDMLTPESIMQIEGIDRVSAERVVSRLLGVILDESEYASPNPDLSTRTLQAGSLQRGTGKGELWRHLMLFKGYSLTMMTRHLQRALHGDMTPAGKVAYTSALVFATTLSGGLVLMLQDLAAGRDPRDATGSMGEDPAALIKFWGASMAKGGGLGFLGDMLLQGAGAHGQSGASAAIGGVAGPVVGSLFELGFDVGIENVVEAAQGKDTHVGAEAFRWARSHTPFVNLWMGKTVLDQAVMNQAQEFLSPGYLAKTRARMERQWGSSWYWEPQDSGVFSEQGFEGPQRAPDLSTAVGGP